MGNDSGRPSAVNQSTPGRSVDWKLRWLSAALLLASYIFGYNFHNIIHELGHAVTIWVQGGSIHGLVLHPFLSCYAPSTAVPNHVLLYAGGALIGGTFTIVFAILAWRVRTPYMMPLVMTCVAGLVTTSRWMLLAPFTTSTTDYYFMIELGVPAILIFLWGVLFLVIGVSVLSWFLPLLGLGPKANLLDHFFVIVVGILPYQLAASGYYIATGISGLAGSISTAISVIITLAILAAVAKGLTSRFELFRRVEVAALKPRHIVVAWSAAVLLIVLMFVFTMSRDAVI
jgi:hypothetical protein